jgi:spermidine synthase
MHGTHLTADLYSCEHTELMTDVERLREVCRTQIERVGLKIVGEHWHQFTGLDGAEGGVTGALVLAESHFTIHTWPELCRLTMDLYVCNMTANHSAEAEVAISSIASYFGAVHTQWQDVKRGDLPALAGELQRHFIEPVGTHGAFFGFAARKLAEDRMEGPQRIEVLESPSLGVALRLDDRLMTSEREGFYYHEALIHPAAIIAHKPKSALIIGGGDLGSAKEILRHRRIERVVVVEIDGAVVHCAQKHLQRINGRCWDDTRLTIKIQDGADFIRSSADKFDLIYLDLTDVDSGAESLYREPFFRSCQERLSKRGVLVAHAGAVFHHDEQIKSVLAQLKAVFPYTAPYVAPAPLYGGLWTYCLASSAPIYARRTEFSVGLKLRMSGVHCHDLQFYGPRQHAAMFDMVPASLRVALQTLPGAKRRAKDRMGMVANILFSVLALSVAIGAPLFIEARKKEQDALQAEVLSGQQLSSRLQKMAPPMATCALNIFEVAWRNKPIKLGDAEWVEEYCAMTKDAAEEFLRKQDDARAVKRDQDQAITDMRGVLAGKAL